MRLLVVVVSLLSDIKLDLFLLKKQLVDLLVTMVAKLSIPSQLLDLSRALVEQ